MSVEGIRTAYAYNRWANRRLLGAVAQLQPQDFVRHMGGSFGSVQATLVHIMWGEWLWLRRWRGESPRRLFDPKEFPRAADIKTRWDDIARDQADFVANLTDERLAARISYENLQGQRWELGLIRFGGHLSKGGYDVQNGIKQHGKARAPTVHRGVHGWCRPAGVR